MIDNALITIGLPISIFVTMIGMGLSLTTHDFRRVAEQRKGVVVGILLQLLVIPAVGFAVGSASGGGLFAVGVVLLASLPGGATSNVLCYLARANLALSITLTVVASLLTIVTIPLYVNLALDRFMGEAKAFSLPVGQTLLTMIVIVVIPVGIGMFIKSRRAELAARAESVIGKFAVVLLIAIVAGIVIAEREHLAQWLVQASAPVLAFNLGALLLGLLAARITGLTIPDGLTLSIEVCIKNTALGLTIALSLLESTELALPIAIYALLMYGSVAVLAMYGRRVAAAADAEAASS